MGREHESMVSVNVREAEPAEYEVRRNVPPQGYTSLEINCPGRYEVDMGQLVEEVQAAFGIRDDVLAEYDYDLVPQWDPEVAACYLTLEPRTAARAVPAGKYKFCPLCGGPLQPHCYVQYQPYCSRCHVVITKDDRVSKL